MTPEPTLSILFSSLLARQLTRQSAGTEATCPPAHSLTKRLRAIKSAPTTLYGMRFLTLQSHLRSNLFPLPPRVEAHLARGERGAAARKPPAVYRGTKRTGFNSPRWLQRQISHCLHQGRSTKPGNCVSQRSLEVWLNEAVGGWEQEVGAPHFCR